MTVIIPGMNADSERVPIRPRNVSQGPDWEKLLGRLDLLGFTLDFTHFGAWKCFQVSLKFKAPPWEVGDVASVLFCSRWILSLSWVLLQSIPRACHGGWQGSG